MKKSKLITELKKGQIIYDNIGIAINQCPEFPFFGASYPDARCIDGQLWNLDKCDDKGLHVDGDNPPCPFCNVDAFIDYHSDNKSREYATKWAKDIISKYSRISEKK